MTQKNANVKLWTKAVDLLEGNNGRFYSGDLPAISSEKEDIGPKPRFMKICVQFPRTMQDTLMQETIKLRNVGTRAVDFNSYTGNSVFQISTSTGVTLLPGGEIDVTVTFNPVAATSELVSEVATFNFSEGLNVYEVPLRISGSKVNAAQTLVFYGDGGTLSVAQDNTRYILTAPVESILYNVSGVKNSTVDLAGFDVVYAGDHGVQVTQPINHCELTDTVGGSRIRQDDNTAAIHSIYHHTQSANAYDFYITGDIECNPVGEDSSGHDTESSQAPTGLNIDGLIINSTSTQCSNRHALHSVMFKCGRARYDQDSYIQLKNIRVYGGCQGGIHCNSTRYLITECQSFPTSTYTNGFGLYAYGPHGLVFNNIVGDGGITDYSGRGIMVNKSYTLVFENTVDIQQNRYEGSDSNSISYGIQTDPDGNDLTGTHVFENNVRVSAVSNANGNFGAHGVKFTGVGRGSVDTTICNNIVSVVRIGSAASTHVYALAVACEGDGISAGLMSYNLCTTDGSGYFTDWSGINGVTIRNNSFADGSNLQATRYYYYCFIGDDTDTVDLILDNDKLSEASFNFSDIYVRSEPTTGPVSITVQHKVTIQVNDQTDAPIAGAALSIDNAQSSQVFNSTTNASGQVEASLVDFVISGLNSSAVSTTNPNNHLADVSAVGYLASNGNVINSDGEKTVTLQLVAA